MLQQNQKSKKTKIVLKAPTQERSRQTVTTILDACSRLLLTEGFYNITTDKIAKEAGVSIGSLYQFFGNKESVVLAVIKQMHQQDRQLASERMANVAHLNAEERIRALIRLGFDVLKANAELRSRLLTVQYYLADSNYIREQTQFFEDLAKTALADMPGRNLEKVSFVFINSFIGMMNSFSINHPDFDKDEALLKEIETLFLKYLDVPLNP